MVFDGDADQSQVVGERLNFAEKVPSGRARRQDENNRCLCGVVPKAGDRFGEVLPGEVLPGEA